MTVSNEHLLQAIIDNRRFETERYKDIMAQASDILAKITALAQTVDAMKAAFDKAMADVAVTVPAGHAAILDGFVGPLEEISTKIGSFEEELTTKLKSIQVPGAP